MIVNDCGALSVALTGIRTVYIPATLVMMWRLGFQVQLQFHQTQQYPCYCSVPSRTTSSKNVSGCRHCEHTNAIKQWFI